MRGKHRSISGKLLLAMATFIACASVVYGHASAATGINQEISFEGKIVNSSGVNIADNTYNMEFKIYTAATACAPTTGVGCTLGWTEDWLVSAGHGVTTKSGTFEVNLDSVAANNFSGIDFNSNPLYLSIQIGNTSSCTPAGNFTLNCGGDNEMKPYILLTSTPYALNAGLLGGLAASSFAQLGATQTFTGANTFQPTTNISSETVLQNSSGSFGQDIFDVEGSSGSGNNFIQVTSTAANQGAVSIQSLGSNNLTLGSGSNTISVAATNITGTGALTVAAGGTATAVDVEAATTGNVSLGISANNKTVNIGAVGTTANTTTVNIADSTGAAQTVNIGDTNSSSAVTIKAGTGNIKLTPSGTSNSGVLVNPTNNTTAALTVQNNSGLNLFNIDTSSNNANNLLTNPGVESAISGNWTAKNGSGTSTITQVTSPVYDGNDSLQIVTTGTATNAGVTQSYALANTTTYVLSVYVSSQNGLITTAGAGAFDMGYGSGGTDTSCLTGQQVAKGGWTRFTCSFTTATLGSSPYIYFKQTDATNRTFYIDSADLETDANATSKWQDGKISLDGTITSPVIITPNQNSTNTFVVQNSSGINAFEIDTTDTNLVNNPGMEVNSVGWSYNGTASGSAGIFRDTSTPYQGIASLKLITTATATDGAKFTFSPNTLIQASTQYTMSFFAKLSAGSLATLTFGRSENGTQTSCVTTGSINTTWQRYSCTFTVGATIGATPYIYIGPGTGTQTMWIDDVSLEPGAVATPYGISNIYLNGVIESPALFQDKNNSTVAFQIQNSGSTNLLTADTSNSRIILGVGNTGETTPTILVLDSSSNSTFNAGTDTNTPAEVDGSMFYSKTDNQFLCGVAGSYIGCNGLLYSNTAAAASVNTCTTACTPAATAPIPANFCQAGRTIHVIARGTWGDTGAAPSVAFGIYYGTSTTKASDTLIGASTSAITGTSTNSTGMGWSVDATIICFSTTSMNLAGVYVFQPSTTTTTANTSTNIVSTTTTGLTTNAAKNLYIFPAFGTSNAANAVILNQFIVTSN